MWPFRPRRSKFRRPSQPASLGRAADQLEPRTLLSTIQSIGAEGVSIATASVLDVDPAVASNSAGAFVMVDYTHGGDGSGFALAARVFSANGVATTAQFQVNTTTVGSQWQPDVAMAADGSFVVVWQNHGNSDGQADIFARRYNAAGQPLSGEFQVNVFTTSDQINPKIAMAPDGRFVVIWEDTFGLDTDASGIFGRFYLANGTAVGGDFQINGQQTNSDFIGSQIDPDVAMDASGRFAVIWNGPISSGGKGIKLRRFTAAGASTTNEVVVTTNPGNVLFPSPSQGRVGIDADGDVVVAWEEGGLDGDSFLERNIYARRYNSNLTPQPVSDTFRVNTTVTSDQEQAAVALSPNGDFLISWQSTHPADGFDDVFAQFYNADGTTSGSELRVNTTTSRDQRRPDIAFSSSTRAIVTWYGLGVGATGLDIYHQRYDVSVPPPPADDTTVSVDAQNRLLITDTGTTTNDQLTVTLNMSGDVVITDPNARLGTAIAGAVLSADAHTLTVPRSSFGPFVQADLRDGDDEFDSSQLVIQARVFAGSGNDLILTGALADSVDAGAGNDTVSTGAGNDTANGGNGADSIDIRGGSGNDLLNGNAGFDTLFGDDHDDELNGGTQNDALFGGSGNDDISGDAGDDRIFADGDDTASGGTGDDSIRGGQGADILRGNNDSDTLHGDQQNDTLEGGASDDTMTGGLGADLYLTAGNDQINSDSDDSTQFPQAVDTTISIDGSGNLLIVDTGNATNDRLTVTTNSDGDLVITDPVAQLTTAIPGATISGDLHSVTVPRFRITGPTLVANLGGGNDEFTASQLPFGTVVDGGAGNDLIQTDLNSDLINAGDGDDTVFGGGGGDRINGQAGDDRLFGDGGADTVTGGTGNDFIRGGDGADQLRGDANSDTIFGDQQTDTLTGGTGNGSADPGDSFPDAVSGEINESFMAAVMAVLDQV
jgi:Ca2+-binding RTX toxin-like protein